jgi:small subunit ribosomal protein S35
MGEVHPAEKKVVVEFTSLDLQKATSLTEPQRIKLVKLAGVRYNPSTDVIRMSSEKFEHAAQNKRYLGDMVNKLVAEAQNEEDMFEDIPLDYRHHKEKKKPVFPEEWKLNHKRVQDLQTLRAAERIPALEAPVKKREEEGARRVAEYVAAMPLGRRDAPATR